MRRDLTEELLALCPEADRGAYRALARHMEGLGYRPRKQGVKEFTLSYAHAGSGRVLAKLGVRKGAPYCAVKFFGMKDAPGRLRDALLDEIEARKGQYTGPIRNVSDKARCDFCPACTGGGLGYFCVCRDGTEVLRCGAYPIPIPYFGEGDLNELRAALTAQHEYFEALDAGGCAACSTN